MGAKKKKETKLFRWLLWAIAIGGMGFLIGAILARTVFARPCGSNCKPEPPPPVCEIEMWSCEECQEPLTIENVCFNAFGGFCQKNYGCRFVCLENGPFGVIRFESAFLIKKPGDNCEWVCKDTCEPEPTPTSEPEPEVRGTTPAGPPICVEEPVSVAPSYNADDYIRVDDDTIIFNWGVTDPHAQSYGIYYGTEEDNLPWYTEVPGHATESATINGLPAGHIWRKICSIGACGDQVCGLSLDP